MIIVPMGTDAPIYHWPYATVGLIVVNVALAFVVPPVSSAPALDDDGEVVEEVRQISNFDRYALAIGDGRLHPVQWVTHNFLHYGLIHLAGNMLFLWAFGIVVEGKLGAVKYLLAYLAIGTLHGAFVQILLIRSGIDAHAAGASAVVYGLLAICMVWAPRNELNCLAILLVGFRTLVYHWDLRYTTVAILYVGEQVVGLVWRGWVGGSVVISELGHLSGAFWGLVVGVALLKARLVDCEDWDVFSLWAKRKKLAGDWKKRAERLEHTKAAEKSAIRANVRANKRAKSSAVDREDENDGPSDEERALAGVLRVRSLIQDGKFSGALEAYERGTRMLLNWPAQPDLYSLIKEFHARGALADSIRPMRDHCRRFPKESSQMRVKLAQVLLRDRQRPVAALRVLDEIPAGVLPAELDLAQRNW